MGYASRVSRAANRSAKANRLFENLEQEFLSVAQDSREVYNELQAEIDHLRDLQVQAATTGQVNENKAKRVREFFL